jgi:hypothetical protein
MFGWKRDESVTHEDFAALATLVMRMDGKLDAILDDLDINYGEETDHP